MLSLIARVCGTDPVIEGKEDLVPSGDTTTTPPPEETASLVTLIPLPNVFLLHITRTTRTCGTVSVTIGKDDSALSGDAATIPLPETISSLVALPLLPDPDVSFLLIERITRVCGTDPVIGGKEDLVPSGDNTTPPPPEAAAFVILIPLPDALLLLITRIIRTCGAVSATTGEEDPALSGDTATIPLPETIPSPAALSPLPDDLLLLITRITRICGTEPAMGGKEDTVPPGDTTTTSLPGVLLLLITRITRVCGIDSVTIGKEDTVPSGNESGSG